MATDFTPEAGSFITGLDFAPGTGALYALVAKSIAIAFFNAAVTSDQSIDVAARPVLRGSLLGGALSFDLQMTAAELIGDVMIVATAVFPIDALAGPIITSALQSNADPIVNIDTTASSVHNSTIESNLQIDLTSEILSSEIIASHNNSNVQVDLPTSFTANGVSYLGLLSDLLAESTTSLSVGEMPAYGSLSAVELLTFVIEALLAKSVLAPLRVGSAMVDLATDIQTNAIILDATGGNAAIVAAIEVIANSVATTGVAGAGIVDSILSVLANDISDPTLIKSNRRLTIIVIEAERIMVLAPDGTIIVHGIDNVVQTLNSENTILIH